MPDKSILLAVPVVSVIQVLRPQNCGILSVEKEKQRLTAIGKIVMTLAIITTGILLGILGNMTTIAAITGRILDTIAGL